MILHISYHPRPYERDVWHYQEADAILIRWAVHEFNWKRVLPNLNVDGQVTVFNRTIWNILKNFIPHEIIVCDDNDPPWFNKRIKTLIQEGTLLLVTFRKKRNIIKMITYLYNLNDCLTWLINNVKQNYYSKLWKSCKVLTVCYYHARTSFRVNLLSRVCLNIKELLARSRRHIWSLSYINVIRFC